MLLENHIDDSERDPLDFLKYGFYINLKERIDRMENLLLNFKSLDIPTLQMTRVDAKKHKYGAIGCYLSHIHCLEKAKENNYDHILICEDDIQFTNVSVLKIQLRKIIKNVENWDIIMLASNIIRVEKIGGLKYCARVITGMCATGYIVKSHYYDKLLQNFYDGVTKLINNPSMTNRYAVDVYWNSLQRRDMWIIPLPLTVSQLSNYSNIENRYVNYDTLMLKQIYLKK
jgi:GR25 family glycosyltransferase involved in LPS biosynthesis